MDVFLTHGDRGLPREGRRARQGSAWPGAALAKGRPTMNQLRAAWRSAREAAWPFLILIIQNLVIFQNHYFRNYTFPWDFGHQLYAFPAFWTTVVGQGVYPAWVPFFGMGMPFDLILQSGLYYPPLYVFPLLRIPYSLHAAVVVQSLHVLLGAIGMFVFLRRLPGQQRLGTFYAVLGAFIFQFFGGFYSNAEHVDIVRAFAMMPWLFFAFTLPAVDERGIPWRFLLIPPLILFAATGAYPGNLISSLVVVNLYLVCQLAGAWARRGTLRAALQVGGLVLGLEVLGAGLSAIHLGPGWFFRGYLQRSTEFTTLARLGLGPEHLPALFLDNAVVPGEVSMTSTFVTLPALILVTYLPLKELRKQWPIAIVLLFSTLMAAGDRSFLGYYLPRWFEVLRYSRWPSSDYRGFVALALICFAVLSLRAILTGEISNRSFLVRTLLVGLWFALGIQASYPTWTIRPVLQAATICLATIVGLVVYVCWPRRTQPSAPLITTVVLVLIALDGARVLPQMKTWQDASSRSLHLYDIARDTPVSRPARIEKKTVIDDYSWEGFITGRYTLHDLVLPNMLASASLVLQQPAYKEFMLAAWTPLFYEGYRPETASQSDLTVSPEWIDGAFRAAVESATADVRQTRYGLNEIDYQVSLESPTLMIENEMYFPGWTARLTSPNGATEIRAISVDGLFRAWYLPAGDYAMQARFEFPYRRVFAGISAAALAAWAVLVFLRIRSGAAPRSVIETATLKRDDDLADSQLDAPG